MHSGWYTDPMKKYLTVALLALILVTPQPTLAAPKSEISVTPEGKVIVKNARIVQAAGRSFFARAEWNDIFLRMLIRTDVNTKITKHFRGTAQYSEILEGHYVNFEGRLNSSSDTFDILASSVQDISLDSDLGTFSGTITSVNSTNNTFSLSTKSDGIITVSLSNSPTITKGALTLTPSLVHAGDKVLAVTGSYTFPTKTLVANGITLFQDPAQFAPQTFIGTFKATQSTTLPTTMTAVIDGKAYTVRLAAKTQILNTRKAPVLLTRFDAGDSIRIYGRKVESLDLIIDAEVVRNISL